jgi:hypothetical protein
VQKIVDIGGVGKRAILKKRLKHLLNFRDYFQTESTEPIDFSGRHPPNLQHDLLYLSSYIHDATFLIKQVELREKKLTIPMERTRWELYDSLETLEVISSVLAIEHVEEITWELPDELSELADFIVSKIFFGETFWDNFGGEGNLEIILAGTRRSKLRIQVANIWGEERGGFRLIDLPDDDKRLH